MSFSFNFSFASEPVTDVAESSEAELPSVEKDAETVSEQLPDPANQTKAIDLDTERPKSSESEEEKEKTETVEEETKMEQEVRSLWVPNNNSRHIII